MKSTYIQRKRTKGFNLQAQSPDGREVVSCTRPGPWGNPITLNINEGARTYTVLCNGSLIYEDYLHPNDTQIGLVVKYYRRLVEKIDSLNSEQRDSTTLPGWLFSDNIRHHLSGKHLSCWCAPGAPCHVQDVLLPILNGEEPRNYNV